MDKMVRMLVYTELGNYSVISNARLVSFCLRNALSCAIKGRGMAEEEEGGPPRPTTILSKSKSLPFHAPSLPNSDLFRGETLFGLCPLVVLAREEERREGWREGGREGEDLVSGSIWHGRRHSLLLLLRAAAARANRAVGFSERSAMCCKHRNADAAADAADAAEEYPMSK